jgi:predicted ester cyclase
MSTEEETKNKASIRRLVDEALNKGQFGVLEETRGHFAEGGKSRMIELRAAFPDLNTTIEQLIAEGDWVAHRMVHRGTHLGEFRGIAPTGRQVEFSSIVMNRFKDGVSIENWGLHDIPQVIRQLTSETAPPEVEHEARD